MRTLLVVIYVLLFNVCFGIEQRATITHFEANLSEAITGAVEYQFSGNIRFAVSKDDFKNLGDSIAKAYLLTLRFKEGNSKVKINIGFAGQFGDEEELLTLHQTIKLSLSNVHNYSFTFTVPAAAFNLTEGQHTLTPILGLTDDLTRYSILRKEKVTPVTIKTLLTTKVRVWVKYILVDSLDAGGDLWDYFLLNPIDANPDIAWSLNYAGLTYYSSKTRKNVFEYFDNDKQESFDLTISKGDTISIAVKDIDVLTPDDIIGIVIAPPAYQTGIPVNAKAGQIKTMQYSISPLP